MTATHITADIAIVGAGMAGASLAAEIGDAARVVLIEGEAQPGYHSTGRSAAFWSETYGGPAVQPLTSASFAYLDGHGFLGDRTAIHIARPEYIGAVDAMLATFAGNVALERVAAEALPASIPGLRQGFAGGVAEPSCRDIDVAGLHAHYLGRARRAGTQLIGDARVRSIARVAGGWRIATDAGTVEAALLVDAAGAGRTNWRRSRASRRSASSPIGAPSSSWRSTRRSPRRCRWCSISPAASTSSRRRDVFGCRHMTRRRCRPATRPDELDIAIAIDRLERTVDWRIVRVERAWAGLRSFAPDRAPVYGFDDRAEGFFWFAGQGASVSRPLPPPR
ncbi:NAD(P)/FAD-dependent oxidoreductase [Rhizorhabdus histidinilytica]